MLQVARLAPQLLGEATDAVAAYLRDRFDDRGATRNRADEGDLYYTVFGLDGLIALQQEPDRERTARWLHSFGAGDDLDLVHLGCLARCWAAVGRDGLDLDHRSRLLARVEEHRSADGGYGPESGLDIGTAYHCYIALGAYQDLGGDLPHPELLANCVAGMRAADGAYSNWPGQPVGITTATAAAITVLRQVEAPVPAGLADWLLGRLHASGGFLPIPDAPAPDLLSTATALHGLSSLGTFPEPIREPCLDYVDTLWTGSAFCGHWADEEPDAEYTFYALLALGHLAV